MTMIMPIRGLPRAPGAIPKIAFLLPYALLERPDPRSASSSCACARQLVRVVALPWTREHREINFRQKNTHMIWKTCFRVFAGRSQSPCFYNELSPSRRPSFHNFVSQLANSTSGPRTAQRRLRQVPGEPGKGLEGLCETSRGPIHRKTPDQPPQRPLCSNRFEHISKKCISQYIPVYSHGLWLGTTHHTPLG